MPELERYSPEEAQAEAEMLREKVESGDASNYQEAEKQLEQRELPPVLERLKNSPLLEQLEDGRVKLKDEYKKLLMSRYRLLARADKTGENPYDDEALDAVPAYPEMEMFIISLMSEHPDEIFRLFQNSLPEKNLEIAQQQLEDFKRSHDYDSGELRKKAYAKRWDAFSKDDLLMHELGYYGYNKSTGKHEGLSLLSGKQVLFVGGGGASPKYLLGRYFSDGGRAVNIDPRARDFWVADPKGEIEIKGRKCTNCGVRDLYSEETAPIIKNKFGNFDVAVIQNVFDEGAVDKPGDVEAIISQLHVNVHVGGLAVIQIDAIPGESVKTLYESLEKQHFTKQAELFTMDGNRGRCYVFQRTK